MRNYPLISMAIVCLLLSFSINAQLSFTSPTTVTFDGFTGAGFSPTPAAGQLDSDYWRIDGLSDGLVDFGSTDTNGDAARGVTSGGVTSGGIYSLGQGAPNNEALWFQAGGSDMTPGDITLRLENSTGAVINTLSIAYDLLYLNDQGRSNSFNILYSLDDVTYTSVSSLDFTTPTTPDALGVQSVAKSTTITGLSIADGATFYLKWNTDDVGGSGSRDEMGFDNIVLSSTAPCTTIATNTDTGLEYCSIQDAIDAATTIDGHTIEISAGTFTENITVNKNITLLGQNAGTSGTDTRSAESELLNSTLTVTTSGNVTIDGVKFLRNDAVAGDMISLGGNAIVNFANNILERNGSVPGTIARGLVISAGSGMKVIEDNLITGDSSGGLFSGHMSWNNGVYVNGANSIISFNNNTIENARTAINFDDFQAGITLVGNEISTSGTLLAFGGSIPTDGQYVLGPNNFINDPATSMINLSNVAETFRLDITNSTLDGAAFSSLTDTELLEVEARMFHKERSASKKGKVTYVTNQQYVNNITTPFSKIDVIQNSIKYADANDVINLQSGTYDQRVLINKSFLTLQSITGISSDVVLEGGSFGDGNGIELASGSEDVTIKNLTVQNFTGASGNANAGIYGVGGNNNLTVSNVSILDNVGGSGFYANGPVDNVTIDGCTISGHTTGARGIVIWNGYKTNISITNNIVTNNNCCGIELQDGSASGVTISNNLIFDNGDNGIGLTGLTSGAGPNVISGNQVQNNGRFGIEIKNPNGTGMTSGDGSIVVSGNSVELTFAYSLTDMRDVGGILVFRRAPDFAAGNVDIPTGVVVKDNTVKGYKQSSDSDGFGIVLEGRNHTVENNTIENNDVGLQIQTGHLPYTGNGGTADQGDQSNLVDDYFGRGNASESCGIVDNGQNYGSGTFSNNLDFRTVGFNNFSLDNEREVSNLAGNTFCSIKKAINDASTVTDDILDISAATYIEETLVISDNITLNGADKTTTIIQPLANTGNAGDARAFMLVNSGIEYNLNDLTIDGNGKLVYQAIRQKGYGTIDNVRFTDIKYNESGPHYQGVAVAAFGTGNVDITNSMFDEIGRIGALYFGTGITGSTFDNNSYVGKGDGDWLDYALDISAGAVVNVTNNTISQNTGVASVDGSTSAGILVSTYFAPGTTATITGNDINNNTSGIAVGYDGTDASSVHASNNDIYDNDFGLTSTNPSNPINASSNYWGAADGPGGNGAGSGNDVSAGVDACPFYDDFVNSGALVSCRVQNITTGEGFANIQDAIDALNTANGDIIEVDAGNYFENIVVDKSLTIRGPNTTISPNTGTRVPEAILYPASSESDAIILIQADNVIIDGFTLDGDNSNLSTGWPGTNGADIDVYDGIASYDANNIISSSGMQVLNNIIKNVAYFGVDNFGFYNYNNPATSGHLIQDNLFSDLGTYDSGSGIAYWGGGILIYNDNYTRIVDNVMTNVRMGIQTGNFHDANPGTIDFQEISNNTIQARRRGIFYNLHTGPNVEPLFIKDNTITGISDVNESVWDGILISSLSHATGEVRNNSIDGSGISNDSEGIEVWNVDESNPVKIVGGSVSNVDVGVFVNNYEGYLSDAANNTSALISGIDLTNSIGKGVWINDSPDNENNSTVSAEIIGNTDIETNTADGIGIHITGPNASGNIHGNVSTISNNYYGILIDSGFVQIDTNTISNNIVGIQFDTISTGLANNNNITDNTNGVINNTGADIDVTLNWWGDATGPSGFGIGNGDDVSENLLYCPWLDGPIGSGQPADLPVENITQSTYHCSIQEAIDVAAANDVIEVSPGLYKEDVLINKSISLKGDGNSSTIISGPKGGQGSTVRISSSGVTLSGFGITREGNNITDWNDPTLNNGGGIAIQGQTADAEIFDCHVFGNRTGIDINNSDENNIHDNLIDNNRTGLIFRNQTENTVFVNNFVTNNWTVGILFLDASSGTNSPIQSAINSNFNNNNISANWYGQVVDRQAGATANPKDFECNWFGTTDIDVVTTGSQEPGYAGQIPEIYGGTSTAPVTPEPEILGVGSANLDIETYLEDGADNDVSFGFQPIPNSCTGCDNGAMVKNLSSNEYHCSIQDAIDNATNGDIIEVQTANFTEPGQVVFDKSITLQGQGKGVTTIRSNYNTASSGHDNDASAWMRTIPGTSVTIKDLTLDGNGMDTYTALRFEDSGQVQNVGFNDFMHSSSPYIGIAVQVQNGTVDVTGSMFTNIGRIGVHYRSGVIPGAVISGTFSNNMYVGKGDGDWLDYALDISGGTTINVSNNEIYNNTGEASTDGSTSAGILVTSYFPTPANPVPNNVTITGNDLHDNTSGIAVGFDGSDVSMVTATGNDIYDNENGITSTGPVVNAAQNYWGAADGPGGNGTGTGNNISEGVNACPYYDDFVSTGTLVDCRVQNTTTLESFFHIQDAIDDSDTDNGHVIVVSSGIYEEDVVVDKSITINGPNATISAVNGTRVTEAILYPATSSPFGEIIKIQASDVRIDGLTIDGDNPNLTSGFLGTNGADLDAAEAITVYVDDIENLKVENNIIQNLTYFGITLYGGSFSAPTTSGHLINENLIRDLGTYDAASGIALWGGGILLYNDQYARVSNNSITNVRTGIQTGNFHDPNTGDAIYQTIDGNSISTRRRGIFYNLHTGGTVSPWTVSNNSITGIVDANETSWGGILASSLSNATGQLINNEVDGSGISIPSVGIEVWNVDTLAAVNIVNGEAKNVDVGIFVNSFEGYNTNAGNGGHAIIDNVTLTNNVGIGIHVKDSYKNTSGSSVSAEIKGNTEITTNTTDGIGILITGAEATANIHDNLSSITGNDVGILVDSANVQIIMNNISSNNTGIRFMNTGTGVINDNNITNNSIFGVENTTGVDIDATSNWWGDASGPSGEGLGTGDEITINVLYCPWLSEANDGVTPLVTSGPIYNQTQDTYHCTIQDAIDNSNGTAAVRDVILVPAGTYIEDIAITTDNFELIGSNAGIEPCSATRNPETIIHPLTSGPDPFGAGGSVILYFDGTRSNIVVDGLTLDGNNPNVVSGTELGGVDIDAFSGIAGYYGMQDVEIKNNIVKNVSYSGIEIASYLNAFATNSEVHHNSIENVQLPSYGIGVLQHYNGYVHAYNNCLEDVGSGFQTGNFDIAHPGGIDNVIENNTISSNNIGVWHNVTSGNAAKFLIKDNTIDSDDTGIKLTSLNGVEVETESNTIKEGIIGIEVWNCSPDAVVTLTSDIINEAETGIFVNNFEGYASDATRTSHVVVNGAQISNSINEGIKVLDSPSSTNHIAVSMDISNSDINDDDNSSNGIVIEGANASANIHDNLNTIEGNDIGVLVDAGSATITDNTITLNNTGVKVENSGSATINNNNITDNANFGVENTTGVAVDATNNWWGDTSGPSGEGMGTGDPVSIDVLYCPWLVGENDGITALVSTGPVLNNDTGETFCTIQDAIDAATTLDGHTLIASDGLYTESVSIYKNITLESENGAASTSIVSPTGHAVTIAGNTHELADITIDGFTMSSASAIVVQANSDGNLDFDVVGLHYKNLILDAQGQFGIGLFHVENATLDNVTILNASVGIEALGVKDLVVENSNISSATNTALNIWNTAGYPENENITINNSTFDSNEDYAIRISGSKGTLDISGNTISNGGTTGLGWGLYVIDPANVLQVIVDSNMVMDNAGVGVYLDGNNTSDLNATVTNNDFDGNRKAIGVEQITMANISNNNVYNTTQNAIEIFIENVLISENSFVDNDALDIYSTMDIAADCNWWGTISMATINTQKSANVTVCSVLDMSTDSDVAKGFQPSGMCIEQLHLISASFGGGAEGYCFGESPILTVDFKYADGTDYTTETISVDFVINDGTGNAYSPTAISASGTQWRNGSVAIPLDVSNLLGNNTITDATASFEGCSISLNTAEIAALLPNSTFSVSEEPEFTTLANGVTVGNLENGIVDASENVTLDLCDLDGNLTIDPLAIPAINHSRIRLSAITSDNVSYNGTELIIGEIIDATYPTINNVIGAGSPIDVRLVDPSISGQIVLLVEPYRDNNDNNILDAGDCISETVTLTVNVNTLPTPEITTEFATWDMTAGNIATVTTTPGGTYLWSIINGTIDSGNGTESITFTSQTDTVFLSVVVTNVNNCASTVSDTVKVINRCEILDFSEELELADSGNIGIWTVDRFTPTIFESQASGGGRTDVLHHGIDASNTQPGTFQNTQGRKYEVHPQSAEIEIDLYIPQAWESTSRRLAGFWGVAYNATNSISGYPILEFTTDGGVPRFRGYEGDGSWHDLGLPAGFTYDSWVSLRIDVDVATGEFRYSITPETGTILTYTTSEHGIYGSNHFQEVILQGYNFSPGVTYDIYWDNLRTTTVDFDFIVNSNPMLNQDTFIICLEDMVDIELIGNAGDAYSLSFDDGVNPPTVVGSGTVNTNYSFIAAESDEGKYTLTVQSVDGCTSVSDYFLIVNPLPIAISSSTEEACNSVEYTLDFNDYITNLGIAGDDSDDELEPVTYEWTITNITPLSTVIGAQIGDTGSGNVMNTVTNPYNVIETIEYTVVPTSVDGCEGASFVVYVNINENPQATINSNGPTELCQGEERSILGFVLPDENYDYSWDITSVNPGNASITNANSSYPTLTAQTDNENDLTVTFTATNTVTGCSATSEVTFTVSSVPSFAMNEPADLETCENSENGLIGTFDLTTSVTTTTPSGSTVTYYTSSSDANAGGPGIPNPANYTATDGELVFVRLENNGCYVVESIILSVKSLPSITIDAVPDLCENGDAILLNATPAGGTFSGTGVIGAGFDPSISGPGNFTITYNASANGCSNTGSIIITVTDELQIVTNNDDNGLGSLRGILNSACLGDTIFFDASLTGQTISLTSGEIVLPHDLVIQGLGVNNLTISGTNNSRIFNVSSLNNVEIIDLSMINGEASSNGGAFLNNGTITLEDVKLSGNTENGLPKPFTNTATGILIIKGTVEVED